MVRCFNCRNLVGAYFPATVKGALFDKKWKCKATGQVFEMYYLIEMERECLRSKK